MDYENFYITARKNLVESLTSLWFRGLGDAQKYMRTILSGEETLMAKPVFQSIFPWESGEYSFDDHANKLGLFDPSFVNALASEKIPAEYRFPLERIPFKHQTKSWKAMLSKKEKTIIVTSGTGSGKTECFMLPVLQDIAKRKEKNCVQAIFLYPLNALMKSQQERMDYWCRELPGKITYAIYNGDTEKNEKPTRFTSPFFPQLITRPQIRETPPQILFTNPTMLNYMLVRTEDRPILEKSKGKLKWILLDEAHTYTGSSATELALQLRRVLDAFGVTIEQVNFAVTSATIGDEKDKNAELKLKTFVHQLTGKPIDSIIVIGGKRIVPEMDTKIAEDALRSINSQYEINMSVRDLEGLRKELNSKPVLLTEDIAKRIDWKLKTDTEKVLKIINRLGDKVEGLAVDGSSAALLPSRIHYFIRSVSGVYACVNPSCKRHKSIRIGEGSLTTFQNNNCPECNSQMLEVATCSTCGGILITGEESTNKGFRMRTNAIDLESNPFYDEQETSLEADTEGEDEIDIPDREKDGYTPFYLAKTSHPTQRRHVNHNQRVFNFQTNRIEPAEMHSKDAVKFISTRHDEKDNVALCPHCGNRIGIPRYLRASATQMGRMLATTILDNAEARGSNNMEVLYDGKKYITFTDNRQGSARNAMGMNHDVERAWIRSSIFHILADSRLDAIPHVGLTPEEETKYLQLLELKKSISLPSMLETDLQMLEAKKKGIVVIPKLSKKWESIKGLLEKHSGFRSLSAHLKDTYGDGFKENEYLRAMWLDQFGWIPKRSNSMETMGLAHLIYPHLENVRYPRSLPSGLFSDADWRDFLTICVDYVVRGGRHYIIPDDTKRYVTQVVYSNAIYPHDSEKKENGKSVCRWPRVLEKGQGRVQETQPRLVLLLCAVLGYTNPEDFNKERISTINLLLHEAWEIITSKVLNCVDPNDKGYMIDLFSDKVEVQLLDKGFLCPADSVVIDTTFCGYSPRMSGYIGKSNFDRFKVKTELNYPYFPFKSDSLCEGKVLSWIDENLRTQKKLGLYTDLHTRIYNYKPVFVAAEHSAQQSRQQLDIYEKQFKEGRLNVLSCSTTMEMGVDIGGICEVVMTNVPPKSSNYLQRAGRAGRRNESKAMALTFCAPNPIGVHTWQHPDYPITHVIETPLLKLESRQIIQRHVNALVFSDFVVVKGGMKVTSTLSNFFILNDGQSLFNQFLTHIDCAIGGLSTSIARSYFHLVRNTVLENIPLADVLTVTRSGIKGVHNAFRGYIDNLDRALQTARGQSGGNSNAFKFISKQRDQLCEKPLLSYLAENSFLPSAGMPTGLVECLLGKNNKEWRKSFDAGAPTMHLSQAVTGYAPGTEVVKNEWVYKPAGIIMKTKYDNNSTRCIIQSCNHKGCGYTTMVFGSVQNDCPKCGAKNSMRGLRNVHQLLDPRFTEVVEPAAFSVKYSSAPHRYMNTASVLNVVQPLLLKMDPWEEKKSEAKILVRCSTAQSEILFYNAGRNGSGFELCPYCGRMESEKHVGEDKPILAKHTHLSTNHDCPGSEANGGKIRRNVLLVGRYQTDFVEIQFYKADNTIEEDIETLYSLGVILSRKLTELLGVNDGEIDFGYNYMTHSIFIYDTALGGAGYSPLFREYKDVVLRMAYKTLNSCRCERSCTCCLIDRRSQWYLNFLNRPKALEWLELEYKSRTAPEYISKMIPSASTVTSDFSTEMYQLLRNKDIRSIKFFIDDSANDWQLDTFPYLRQMNELSMTGVDVAFVLKHDIDISSYSAVTQSVVMAALLKYKFQYSSGWRKSGLQQLLIVCFNDGSSKTYFGEDINISLNGDWGGGAVYTSIYLDNINYEDVNLSNHLRLLASDDSSFMFEERICENCQLNEIYTSLFHADATKWKKISTHIGGKSVAVTYSDRYLKTPLGCLILAHFIKKISIELSLKIQSIRIMSEKVYTDRHNNTMNLITEDFMSTDERNVFLSEALSTIVGITPNIVNDIYVEHERYILIEAAESELCIRPDGGVAHGWVPFGYNNGRLSIDDFSDEVDKVIKLYNQKARNPKEGILYTISFKKK